ncbi:MAG TPA: DUF3667 domain-containing protein [Gemmatimonadaceae bacterium]|nr:DUF3667 domain-containing protein [Gemmatimonadaceae bacterium]
MGRRQRGVAAAADPVSHRLESSAVTATSTNCLNCGAPLNGAFCASCGQRDIPAYPGVRELAVDAVSEFSGWDGRLASTLRALVQRPGFLTREFLEGRRVRYISPLKLYLTSSLVYFVLAAAAPTVKLNSGRTVGLQIGSVKTDKGQAASRPERVSNTAERSLSDREIVTPEEKAAALRDIERAPFLMRPFLRRVVEDPNGFKRGLLETMPRMFFVLLPIFAGIIALFYRRRKYPEHLYFAIHLHAFIFLALAIAELMKFTRQPLPVAITSSLAVLSIPVYSTLAFRRVYGNSVGKTLAKEIGISCIYAVVVAIGFVVTIYWVSVAA